MLASRKYNQKYRRKWEYLKEFVGWLNPHPKDNKKAYCKYCNVIINAHLCDLKKHARAKKHSNAAALIKTLNQITDHSDVPSIEVIQEDEFDADEDGNNTDYEENNDRWPLEAVTLLIQQIKLNWSVFQPSINKKLDEFSVIEQAMLKEGYHYTTKELSRKYRNIKVRYYQILEKQLIADHKPRIKYFDALNDLFCNEEKTKKLIEEKKHRLKLNAVTMLSDDDFDDDNQSNSSSFLWTEDATDRLLSLVQECSFIDNKDTINDIWQVVSANMYDEGFALDADKCKMKFESMVNHYQDLKPPPESNGFNLPLWRHYIRVRNIMNQVNFPIQIADDMMVHEDKFNIGQTKRKSSTDDHVAMEDPESESSLLQRIGMLTDNIELCNRLQAVENHVDDVVDQMELEEESNTLLGELVAELSILANHLACPNPTEPITLVVPHSE